MPLLLGDCGLLLRVLLQNCCSYGAGGLTEGDPLLPEAIDLIFICDVLHSMDDPKL
jgi:hypothetical protein